MMNNLTKHTFIPGFQEGDEQAGKTDSSLPGEEENVQG